jgi:tetratricopeptide (TPR) repeat protein
MARLRLKLLPLACLVGQLLAQTGDLDSEARRASQLVTAGKPREAIAIYTRLITAAPNDPRLFLALCIAEYKAGKFADAAVHAATASKLDSKLAPADLFLGASYLQLGREVDAVEPLTRAAAAMPNDRSAGLMLGEALSGSKRYKEALAPLQKAANLLPDSARVWYALGHAYEGAAAEAEHELQRSFPDSGYPWALAGDSLLERHRPENAFEAYRKALAKDASIAEAYTGLIAIYRDSGHPDWAAQEESIQRASPQPASSSLTKAAALYAECKKYRQLAAEAYGRLMQLSASAESHVHAAEILDADGLHRQAAAEWQQSLALAPNNTKVRNGLVWSLFRSRDYDSLLRMLPAMLKENPEAAELNFLYGAALLNLQQIDEAMPYLEKAIALDRNFSPAQSAFGQALLLRGKPDEAIAYLKRAIPEDRDGNTHFQLFRAYQLTGQSDLAAKAFADYQRFRDSLQNDQRSQAGTDIAAPSE